MLSRLLDERHDGRGARRRPASGTRLRFGLDAAFPALFLALLIPLLRPGPALAAALLGALIALAFVPFTAAGVPIMLASLACLIGLRR